MIGKTQAARQPSIDELLASIRQAIHARVHPGAPAAPALSPRLVHTTPAALPDSDRAPAARHLTAAGEEGFAGLLGGDVRLEEALARLNQTGWRRGAEAPEVPEAAPAADSPVAAPTAEPRLRPTIEEWTSATASPVAPPRQAPMRSSPARPAPTRPTPVRQAPVRPNPAPVAYQRPAVDRKDEFWDENPSYDATPSARASAGARPGDLLSSEAASAANSAFGRLADAMAGRAAGSERTLDAITEDCLRPLLKDWLDENLPALVERLVREEIERVSRPGR